MTIGSRRPPPLASKLQDCNPCSGVVIDVITGRNLLLLMVPRSSHLATLRLTLRLRQESSLHAAQITVNIYKQSYKPAGVTINKR